MAKLGLLLFIGLPGCGKTTLAKNLQNLFVQNEENQFHFIHVCYDDLIPFQNQSQEHDWKLSRASVAAKVENLVTAIKNENLDTCPAEFKPINIKNKTVIMLDDNFYFKSMRYCFFQMARRCNISFCQVYVNCSLENALLKNSSRELDHVIPSYIIKNMYDKIEPPNTENYWERFSITIDAFCDINEFYEKLFPILNISLDNFEQVLEKEYADSQCNNNIMHQTDLALRIIVGLKIKDYLSRNSSKDAKKYAAELGIRKSEIFSDIKAGVISLPKEILEEISKGDSEKSQLKNYLHTYF